MDGDKMGIEDKIIKVIEKIKPILQNDGGNIEFIKFEDGIVYVKVTGVCIHCYMLDQTLEGIEMALMSEIPEVKKVELA